jgi:septum formation protein
MESIILASLSPRREEFFRLLGLPFTVMPSPANEDFEEGKDPRLVAEELAIRKARAVAEAPEGCPAPWVCGADTLVALDNRIYGKPKDREDAGKTLRALQGRTHQVISAVALDKVRAKTCDCRSVVSTVTFAPLSNAEIEWDLDSLEWQGAAGAYKIQGLASCFITHIEGSYSSIVGLPLREFYVMLRDNGCQYGG